MTRSRRLRGLLAVLAVLTSSHVAALASGWHRDEQGAKATALAQAVTAHVDDPSAVYYNPAALAFVRDRAFYLGFSLTEAAVADFSGVGEGGERSIESRARPHVYWVEPVAGRWAVGLALHQPVGFESKWEQADQWPGRFEARRVALEAWDLDAVAALRVRPTLGVSAGVVLRGARLTWTRDEAGAVSGLRSDRGTVVGAVLAVQHRPPGRWSWGLRWRAGISTTLDGAGSAWSARLSLPDRLTLGVAFAPSPTARLEVDLDHTGWSSLNDFEIRFDDQPALDRDPVSGWRSRLATRIGLRWYGLGNGEWRAGVFSDPTPQPESDLGPFFVDADRFGASIGYGTRVRRLQTDMALVWEEHDTRSTSTHGFDGEYATRLVRLVLSFGW